MRNVLIVDDDTIVRITLHSLIDWEKLGYRIAADAIHGEQALQYLDSNPVDLIISDMKMPVLDGIGLLEALNKKFKDHQELMPKILVLSGYDDFKLVREAFRLGAYDYLLKADLNGELLKNMLERLNGEQWAKELSREEPEKNGERGEDGERPIPAADASRRLSEMAMGKRELEEALFDGDYLVVQFEVEDFQKQAVRFTGDFEEKLVKPMMEFANQIPRVVSRCVLGTISPSRYVMIYRISEKNQYRSNVESTCRQLKRVWNNYLNLPVSAGISSPGNGAGQFLSRFEEAGGCLALRYLKGKTQICTPWEKNVVSYEAVARALERYKHLLTSLLTADELEAAEEKNRLIAGFYGMKFEEAKRECLYMICCLAWILSDSHDDISALFPDEINYYEKIGRIDEMRNLELWINNYFRWIMDYAVHHIDRQQADMMMRAKRFILDNYGNPELTLASVAGYVGLNEKYFTTRFTKEEGMTFSSYLTEVRIRKAKELMKQTDLKIYEVSQSVGYNSVEHFTRVFKKICGISPGAYRR